MGWKGTIRAIQAAKRRAQRDAQRRFKELQRRTKEQAKISALKQARLEVETYENRIEVLLSIHKEQSDHWNWEFVLNTPPIEPVRSNRHEADVEARRSSGDVSLFLFVSRVGLSWRSKCCESSGSADENDRPI
jgi:hypothetical protein